MSSQDSQSIRWHFTAELNDNDLEIHGLTLFFIVILFAVVVLITLLLVYVRWVCRHQHHHFPSHPSVHAPHSPPSQSQGLHPRIIKAITITWHQSSSTSSSVEAECCICLGVFEDGDKVKVLALCHHSFHSECLDRWLAAGSSCPLCRASLHCNGSPAVSISTD